MAECLICQAKFDSDGAGSLFFVACDRCHEAQDETHRFGVCPSCCADAALGRVAKGHAEVILQALNLAEWKSAFEAKLALLAAGMMKEK